MGEEGRVAWLIATCADMTDRYQPVSSHARMPFRGGFTSVSTPAAEHRTSSEVCSKGKFRALTENTASAIVILQDGQFRYVNPAAESIRGYTREELLHLSLQDLIHPDSFEEVQERIAN